MFIKSILVGAFAALATAQSTVISFTNALPSPAEVGKPFTLTYATTGSGPVSIILRKGNPNDLQTVATLTSDATGGSYEWTPASELASGTDYALQIQQGSEINYLGPFPLTGGSGTGIMSSMSSMPEGSTMTVTMLSANGTASMTSTAMPPPYGTGNATMTRNATLSSATLTRTATPTSSHGGATYQGTSTGPNAAQNTGGASTLMVGGSAVALVIGAVAAVVMG